MSASNHHESGRSNNQNLWDRYVAHATARPGALAVADDSGSELDHAQLLDATADTAAALAEAGIRSGDLVLQIMPNRVEWQVTFGALLRLGAVPMTVPVTTDQATLSYLCDLAEAVSIITVDQAGHTRLAEIAARAAVEAQHPTSVIVTSTGGHTEVVHPGEGRDRQVQLGDVAHVMTTSSTTGRPKAVTHSESTLGALNQAFADRFALNSTTAILMVSPLGHSVGAIHGARLAMFTGSPLILQQRWDPAHAMELSDRYSCEFTALATPFLKDFIDAPDPSSGTKLSTMRTILCGGAAVPPLLMDQADKQFPNTFVSVLWGMTEGGVTTCVPESTHDQRRDTAGCGLPGLELSVVSPALEHLPIGEVGELVMRGPGVFTGYLGQDDLYASSLTTDGYFRTGDLARLDTDGYLHLTGRLKDLIIRGGVNISPVMIEDTLAGHPDVRRVAVVGEPDDRLGELLCAVVVPQEGKTVSLQDLIDWAQSHQLSQRYWPESIRIVDEMPVTAAGKIRKNQLQSDLFGGPQ